MKKQYNVSEKAITGAVKSVLNEFFDRSTMDSFKAFGIKDPTEGEVVDEAELKEKCGLFLQKCNEFSAVLKEFYGYIDGVEEDAENGVQGQRGVRSVIRGRNLFGARNVHDEFLEEDINTLEKSLWELQSALRDAYECAEVFS